MITRKNTYLVALMGVALATSAMRCGNNNSEIETSREDAAISDDEKFLDDDDGRPASESVPEMGEDKYPSPASRSDSINDEDALDEDSTYMEPPSSSTEDTDEQ